MYKLTQNIHSNDRNVFVIVEAEVSRGAANFTEFHHANVLHCLQLLHAMRLRKPKLAYVPVANKWKTARG